MEGKNMLLSIPVTAILVLAGVGLFLCSCGKKSLNVAGWNRRDFQKKIEEIDNKYEKNKTSHKLNLEYAQKLFEVGNFSKSEDLLQPLLSTIKPPSGATYLAAHINYLHGHYAQAEKLFESINNSNAPFKTKINAQIGLVGTAYQTNQFYKARNLFKGLEGKIQLGIWETMKGFGDEKPYQIEWKGKNKTIVPFVVTDPLPVIAVEINGKQIFVFLDTGAEIFYLDESLASTLGIKPISKQIEPYAGGKTVEVSYAYADSLQINEITIKSIPVKLGSIQRFSEMFPNNLKISGILSTGVLQQFLSTIDYPDGRLILRPRNEESRGSLKTEFSQNKTVELPFVLGMTHIMVVKGAINGKDSLNLFLDSGLADSSAVLLPKQTLDYVGVPIPPTITNPKGVGGLGGNFPVGSFKIAQCKLGPLEQDNLTGLYGVFPPELYLSCEFIIDGIVSHQFLKKYKWTIDFDSMKMLFTL